MLDGIETGYEAKWDFPYRQNPPERVYMLASVPRTGSTFLSHLLWQSGRLGAPLEYLNFLATGPYGFASGSPDKQTGLWQSALQRRTSPNGVFGVKCFPLQLRELQQHNPALLLNVMATLLPRGTARYVVRLKRRDSDAHAISYARAALSGVWRKEQEGQGSTAEYSAKAVDHARELLSHQEREWDLLFSELGIEPLILWHEDVVEQPLESVRSVAAYLGVALDAAAAIAVPHVEKQSDADSKLWAQRYGSPAKR